ncbi:MAG: winged helix-turn-helix domain-containing protein [Candidatus Limnocylindria bacterium]
MNERGVELSRREFTVLETLLRHAGQVMSRDQLLDAAWPYGEAAPSPAESTAWCDGSTVAG